MKVRQRRVGAATGDAATGAVLQGVGCLGDQPLLSCATSVGTLAPAVTVSPWLRTPLVIEGKPTLTAGSVGARGPYAARGMGSWLWSARVAGLRVLSMSLSVASNPVARWSVLTEHRVVFRSHAVG